MALLSDIDWLIILGVGGFLLLGKGDPQLLRTVGRWYGRALHLKQELLSEVTKAADLPNPAAGPPLSIRTALLGEEPTPGPRTGVPIAVARAPMALATVASASPGPMPALTWVNSLGPQQWSVVSARSPSPDGGGP